MRTSLNYLFRQGSYFIKTFFFDFPWNRAENAASFRLFSLQNHNCVVVKADV